MVLVLGLGSFGLFFIFNLNKETETSSIDATVHSETESTTSVPQSFNTEPSIAVSTPAAALPHLEFPPGSVEEACGFNKLVSYHAYIDAESDEEIHWPQSLFDASGKLASFFSES